MNAPLKLRPDLSLLGRLEQSQWWTPRQIARAQSRRLAAVARQARATVPFFYWSSFTLEGFGCAAC